MVKIPMMAAVTASCNTNIALLNFCVDKINNPNNYLFYWKLGETLVRGINAAGFKERISLESGGM
jgi:hypothetical protein